MNTLQLENLSPNIERQFQEVQEQAPDVASQEGLTQSSGGNFSDLIQNALEKVNQDQVQADIAVREVISGRNKNIHEALMAVEKADMSLKLMTQVRNKVLDAYREIMRMQV